MTPSGYRFPDALITTQALADSLNDPDLRLYDCTLYLVSPSPNDPYVVQDAQADHDAGHIPGAVYVDLQRDLSRPDGAFRFTMPEPSDAAQRFAALGIGNASRVVLYSRGNLQWSTRVWWMLRAIGVDQVAILDGGWEKWLSEDRPVSRSSSRYAPAPSLAIRPRPGLFVGREAVQAAINDPGTVVLNALSAELHAGHSRRYGRPGRIPGSVNVPATSLRDPVSLALVPPATAQACFDAAGVRRDKPTLIYCGGGIAATLDAFVLHQLGYDQISVYDNSLSEWSTDATLPLESDPPPSDLSLR